MPQCKEKPNREQTSLVLHKLHHDMDTNDKIDISTPIIEKINSTVGRDRKGKARMNATSTIQYKNVKR